MLLLTGGLFRSMWLVDELKSYYASKQIIIPDFGRSVTGTRSVLSHFLIQQRRPGTDRQYHSDLSVVEGCLARFEPSACAGDRDFGLGISRDEAFCRSIHPDIDPVSLRGTFRTREDRWAKERWRNLLPFVSDPDPLRRTWEGMH